MQLAIVTRVPDANFDASIPVAVRVNFPDALTRLLVSVNDKAADGTVKVLNPVTVAVPEKKSPVGSKPVNTTAAVDGMKCADAKVTSTVGPPAHTTLVGTVGEHADVHTLAAVQKFELRHAAVALATESDWPTSMPWPFGQDAPGPVKLVVA